MYVKIKDNNVEVYPYRDSDLRRDNPDTSFPSVISPDMRAEFGVFPVTRADAPVPVGQRCTGYNVVLIDGVWTEEPIYAAAPAPSAEEVREGYATELSSLDVYIPRGLEDQWAVTGFDTTLLPQVQQDRLTRKKELRALLANI